MKIAQNWRLKAQRYAFTGTKCAYCGNVSVANRPVCPSCEGKPVETNPITVRMNENIAVPARQAAR